MGSLTPSSFYSAGYLPADDHAGTFELLTTKVSLVIPAIRALAHPLSQSAHAFQSSDGSRSRRRDRILLELDHHICPFADGSDWSDITGDAIRKCRHGSGLGRIRRPDALP